MCTRKSDVALISKRLFAFEGDRSTRDIMTLCHAHFAGIRETPGWKRRNVTIVPVNTAAWESYGPVLSQVCEYDRDSLADDLEIDGDDD